MTAPSLPRPVTYEEFLRLPEGGIYNLVGGLLLHEPSPGEAHQSIVGNVYASLRAHVHERRLGRVYVAPLDVHLEPTETYEPDVFFVSEDRLPRMRDRGLFDVAPDLVVEVLSPYTARYDRGVKRRGYARHGCREYWVVDPRSRTVEVYVRDGAGDLVARGSAGPGATLRSAVLPDLRLPVESVFA